MTHRALPITTVLGALALIAATLLPGPGAAQAPGKSHRIAYLSVVSREASGHLVGAFTSGLQELGYKVGANLTIQWRFADGNYDRLPALAAELVRLKPDVIVASSTPAIAAAQRATSTIPIVMCVTADPLGAGFVKSLARPGGNVTGSASPSTDYGPKQVELAQRIVSGLTRVAVLINPGNATHPTLLRSVRAAAGKTGLTIVPVEARSSGEIEAAIAQQAQRSGALLVFPDGLFLQQRGEIAELAAKHRLPTIYQLREHVEVGGLMSYGQDLSRNYRLAAAYVDKILRGARAGDLPIEQSSKLELVINARSAKALGISIPKDVLFLADKVIE